MFLVGAISAESSYDTLAGSVGAGEDPTVGLLQIRFSSTIRDFADYGPFDHIGMACHLMGAEAAHSSLSGADYYCDNVKSWFDPCVSHSGTHPFELTIEPDTNKYCG